MRLSPRTDTAETTIGLPPAWQPAVLSGEADPPAETDWFKPLGLRGIAPNGDPPALMLWGEDALEA